MWIKSLRHPTRSLQSLGGSSARSLTSVRSRCNHFISATAPRQPHASSTDCATRSPYGSLRCSSLARRFALDVRFSSAHGRVRAPPHPIPVVGSRSSSDGSVGCIPSPDTDLFLDGLSMTMTNWRAVGIGFVVHIILGIIGAPIGIGPFVAGLISGFVAGYIAGGSFFNGAWHGLLGGSIGGIVLAVVLGVVVGVAGLTLGPLGGLLGGGVFV